MRCLPLIPAALMVVSAALASPQQASSTQSSDGLDLLKRVPEHYAGAKTYSLAATEENTQSGEYQRHWSKMVMVAAEAPDGKYYFEGHGNTGGAIRVSDGKTAWKYHIEENHYTQQSASATDAKPGGPMPLQEMALLNAKHLRRSLADMTHGLHSASLDPEETVVIDGKPVVCQVIRIRNSDENRADPNAQMEKIIWIDKRQQTIVKIQVLDEFKHVKGLPTKQGMTIIYSKVVLDGPIPDSVFAFTPPAEALLVDEFPDPRDNYGLTTMQGDPIPALKLKSADGKVVPIESFRGKPVIIDFCATSCAPCVAARPKLAVIYKEGKNKGLVLLSIDQDEDPAKATGFLFKHGYDWPNFHDGDGEIAKLMGSSGLPRTVLVDANGRIVFDGMGVPEDRLRMHLTKLGPEFRDFAAIPSETATSGSAPK